MNLPHELRLLPDAAARARGCGGELYTKECNDERDT